MRNARYYRSHRAPSVPQEDVPTLWTESYVAETLSPSRTLSLDEPRLWVYQIGLVSTTERSNQEYGSDKQGPGLLKSMGVPDRVSLWALHGAYEPGAWLRQTAPVPDSWTALILIGDQSCNKLTTHSHY